MQRLNKLWQFANTASQVVELARSSETFRFNVEGATTFYLHTAHAEVRVARWEFPRIEVTAQLQAPWGWRVESEQDEAGVYFVARRRPVVGSISGAVFSVSLPDAAHAIVKLDQGRLLIDGVSGTYELPAVVNGEIQVRQSKS